MQLCLEAGVGVNDAGLNGFTPLIVASKNGHTDVVKELLSGGANINATETDGRTALMFASSNGHTGVVKELLSGGADQRRQDRRFDRFNVRLREWAH
jgi:ankyrin repeat protein